VARIINAAQSFVARPPTARAAHLVNLFVNQSLELLLVDLVAPRRDLPLAINQDRADSIKGSLSTQGDLHWHERSDSLTMSLNNIFLAAGPNAVEHFPKTLTRLFDRNSDHQYFLRRSVYI
jgi:hypothetical protein